MSSVGITIHTLLRNIMKLNFDVKFVTEILLHNIECRNSTLYLPILVLQCSKVRKLEMEAH